MIKNESILCMPLTCWDSDFPNTLVQLMHEMSRENKILFVDYEYTIKDILSGLNGARKVPIQRVLGIEERLREVKTKYGSSVYVLTPPPVLPANWIKKSNPYRAMLQINSQLIKSSIQNALNYLGMDSPMVINGYNPFFGLPLAGAFDETLNIYYCYDEINGDPFYSYHGPAIEKDYIKKTDGVIVTSEALLDSKCSYHSNCFVIKNGVDFNLFNPIASYTKSAGSEKVVGYTGSIDERFDIEFVKAAVEAMPEVKFMFVGRITNKKACKVLSNYPNVNFTGGVDSQKVPEYLKDIDVCIIPYLKNDVTRGVYPLKINEYLAAGKPVVMTDFARISELKGIVSVAATPTEFLSCIKKEMKANKEGQKSARVELAKKNSWAQKAEELSQAIETLRVKKYVLK